MYKDACPSCLCHKEKIFYKIYIDTDSEEEGDWGIRIIPKILEEQPFLSIFAFKLCFGFSLSHFLANFLCLKGNIFYFKKFWSIINLQSVPLKMVLLCCRLFRRQSGQVPLKQYHPTLFPDYNLWLWPPD